MTTNHNVVLLLVEFRTTMKEERFVRKQGGTQWKIMINNFY